MQHSDICHLVFVPADAFYKFTKRLERSHSTLCVLFTHYIQGAHSGLFLSVFNCGGEWLSRYNHSRSEERCGVLCSVAQCQTVSDGTRQMKGEDFTGAVWSNTQTEKTLGLNNMKPIFTWLFSRPHWKIINSPLLCSVFATEQRVSLPGCCKV